MTEWPNVPDSKSGVLETVPGVQIPLSPPIFALPKVVRHSLGKTSLTLSTSSYRIIWLKLYRHINGSLSAFQLTFLCR